MTRARTAPRRHAGFGRRFQAFLSIAALVGSVAGTAVLVATPSSSPAAAASVPGARLLVPGTRVEISGGDPFDAFELADRLTASGARVVTVAPTPEGRSGDAVTSVVYYDRRSMDVARRVRDMLGRGTLRRQQVFQPAVDVTIVLGKDSARR